MASIGSGSCGARDAAVAPHQGQHGAGCVRNVSRLPAPSPIPSGRRLRSVSCCGSPSRAAWSPTSITRSSSAYTGPDLLLSLPYRHIVVANSEFNFGGHASAEAASRSGERPRPDCMVALELNSGHEWRLRRGELGAKTAIPDWERSFSSWHILRALNSTFPALAVGLCPQDVSTFTLNSESHQRPDNAAGSGLVGALTSFWARPIGAQEKR